MINSANAANIKTKPISDAVVYCRPQSLNTPFIIAVASLNVLARKKTQASDTTISVSYTHLTLPTNSLV